MASNDVSDVHVHRDSQAAADDVDFKMKPAASYADVALQLVDTSVATEITPEEDRRALRRIDMLLMPIMFVSYALQYMDKTCLSGATLFGILTDLDLEIVTVVDGQSVVNSSRYSYCSMIFYWGYFLGLFPGVYLSQRFPIGKYVSIMMIIWGAVNVCTCAVTSYHGLLAQRFFLGVTEAGIAPAFSLMTIMWYKRSEQPLRYAIWYSSTGLGTLVGTLLLYAMGLIHGALASWRYQFILIGAITSVWGIVLAFTLPDNPVKARFLSERLKIVAIERLRYEQVGIENKTIKKDQIVETFRDPKTYIYMLMIFSLNLANGASTSFGPVIVQSFGYSALKTILLLGGAGVYFFVVVLVEGLIAVYVRNSRTLIAMFSCLPVIAGSLMMWKSDWEQNKLVPLFGFYITASFPTIVVLILSLVAANTGGHTKKALTSGLIWACYCSSNGIAPFTVRTEEVLSHYPTTWKIILSMMSFVFVMLGVFRFYVFHMNKKRDEAYPLEREEAAHTAFLDLTDGANRNFRFEA